MIMEKPTVEAVRFGSRDVIATSGQLNVKGVQLGGVGDGRTGNWFVSNVQGATDGTRDPDTIVSYFNEAAGLTGPPYAFHTGNIESANFSLDGGEHNMMFKGFAGGYYDDKDPGNDYNGWYIWYSNGQYFGRTS